MTAHVLVRCCLQTIRTGNRSVLVIFFLVEYNDLLTTVNHIYVCNENSEYYYLPKSDEIALGGAAEQKCEPQKINMWKL